MILSESSSYLKLYINKTYYSKLINKFYKFYNYFWKIMYLFNNSTNNFFEL